MVWVAGDMAVRERDKSGLYRWDEWQSFCRDEHITVYWRALPPWLRGIRVGRSIVLARGMSRRETAWTAWHEIGHIMLHVGNFGYWLSLPWGELIISKHDTQADDWARLFPVWEEE